MLATAMPSNADQNILGLLAESPQVKRMVRERAAAVTAERASKLRDLRALEAEAATDTPRLIADVERITAEKKKVDAAQFAVDQRLSTALVAKHNYGVAFGRRHDEIEASLRATASPLIASFVAEMNAEWHKARREPLIESTAESERTNPRTGRHEQYIKTNVKLVAERLRAIREVIAAAEQLAISEQDQTDANIGPKLGELAAKLPPMI
jgi:hypothetical protein